MSKKITALLVLTAILLSTAVFNVTAATATETAQIANFDIDSLELENGGDIFDKADITSSNNKVYFKYNANSYFLQLYRSSYTNVSFNAYEEENFCGQSAKISFNQSAAVKSAQLRFLYYDVKHASNDDSIVARTSNVAYSFDLKIPSGLSLKVSSQGLPSTSTTVSEGSYLTSTLFEVSSTGTTLKTYNYTKDTTTSTSTSHTNTPFKRNEYINFKIIFDYDKGTFDLYVNNSLLSAGNTLAGTKFLSDFLIYIGHPENNGEVDAFIDNLSYRVLAANDLKQVYVSNAVENGTLTLNETFTEVGKPITFTATPDAGYKLTSVTLDGKAIDGLTFDRAGGTYTIDSLPYGGELKAIFEEKRTSALVAEFDADDYATESGEIIVDKGKSKIPFKLNNCANFMTVTTANNAIITAEGTDDKVFKIYAESGGANMSRAEIYALRNDMNSTRTTQQKEIRTNDLAFTFKVKLTDGATMDISVMGVSSDAVLSKNASGYWIAGSDFITSEIFSVGRVGKAGSIYSYAKDNETGEITKISKYTEPLTYRNEYITYKVIFDYDEGSFDVYMNDELVGENNKLAAPQYLSDIKINIHHQSGYSKTDTLEAYLDDICIYTLAEEDTNIQPSVVKSGSGTVTADKFLVKEGEDVVYTITPDEGKYIRNIYFDCKAVPAFNSEGTTYTIPNITSRRTLKVDFGSYEEGKPAIMISPLAAKEGNKSYIFCKLLPNSAEVSSYGILLSRTNELPEIDDEETRKMPFLGKTDSYGYPFDANGYFGYALINNSEEENTSFYVRPYAVVNGEYVFGAVSNINTAELEELEGIE